MIRKNDVFSLITHHPSLLLSSWAGLAVAREEAGAAVNRAALRWIEGHCRLLAALRALNGNFNTLTNAGGLRGGNGREPFVLGLLAWFAPLRFVLQTFVVKENLLSSRPDEIVSTVNAFNRTVFEFRLRMTPLPV